MAVSSLSLAVPQPGLLVGAGTEEIEVENWYGLQTRPRHEKIVAQQAGRTGSDNFPSSGH